MCKDHREYEFWKKPNLVKTFAQRNCKKVLVDVLTFHTLSHFLNHDTPAKDNANFMVRNVFMLKERQKYLGEEDALTKTNKFKEQKDMVSPFN